MTPVGGTAPETWATLLAGRSGIAALDEDWAQGLPVRMAGRVDVDVASRLSTPEYKRMDRCGHLALIAAREAWAQAGRPEADPERLAVVIGSGYGGLDTTLEQTRTLDASGPRRVSPHTLTRIMTNAPAAWVSIDVGAKGGARTPVSACASGAEAISQAADMIRAGSADVVIAGGVDSCINGLIISGFAQIRALSTRNGDPQSASRPFDRDRDGFVLAEGAAIAGPGTRRPRPGPRGGDPRRRGRVSGDVRRRRHRRRRSRNAASGHGKSDSGRWSAPAGHRPGPCPRDVHSRGRPPGGGSHQGGARRQGFQVTSTKSLTGHLLGGAGALGAIVMIQALKTGAFPGTGNLDEPDAGIDLNLIRTTVKDQPAKAGIANAFGFGGHSTALVITESLAVPMETVVWSKPEHERAGTPLLVMMHGYGRDESRMTQLFDSLPSAFTCAALRGPKVIGDGYGWFLLDYFLTHDFADVISSTNAVFGWIESVKAQHSSVSLFGYSQGMAMASTLLRLRPAQFRAVVGLSGFVLENELLAMSESFESRPPFFWGRDRATS